MRISDWSSDVCSSDLGAAGRTEGAGNPLIATAGEAFGTRREKYAGVANLGVYSPAATAYIPLAVAGNEGSTPWVWRRCLKDRLSTASRLISRFDISILAALNLLLRTDGRDRKNFV